MHPNAPFLMNRGAFFVLGIEKCGDLWYDICDNQRKVLNRVTEEKNRCCMG